MDMRITSDMLKTGYYKPDTGVYDTWSKSLCTKSYVDINYNSGYIINILCDNCNVSISIYDDKNTYIGREGNFNPGNINAATTNNVIAFIEKGSKIKLNFGLFASGTAANYINDEDFLQSIHISIRYISTEKILPYYLESSNDSTDRTNDILSILNIYGKVYLGIGDYYINNLDMPYNTSIFGSGHRTRLIYNGPIGNEYDSSINLYTAGDKNFTKWVDIVFDTPLDPGRYKISADITSTHTGNTFLVWFNLNDPPFNGTDKVNGVLDQSTENDQYSVSVYCKKPIKGITLYAANAVSNSEGNTATWQNISINQIGYANQSVINLNSKNTLRDFTIIGSDVSHFASDKRDINGIIFNGNNDAAPEYPYSDNDFLNKSLLDNIIITGCSANAILLQNTGYSYHTSVKIINCYCSYNYCGLNIFNRSEFNNIINSSFNRNTYGVINNGGNNTINNCTISGNVYGFVIDTENGSHSNSGHGNMVSCILQHNVTNSIIIKDTASGYTITGCNIDDGDILLKNQRRTIFVGNNFMYDTGLIIDGGGMLVFSACNFRSETIPRFQIINNTSTHFHNCYDTNTGKIFDPINA